ncbi:MAG TPA: hypothetical protein VGC08_16500 [Pedobacter sp.]
MINNKSPLSTPDSYKGIKQAIWAYFFLLLFEGALRKWVLPGLATPLLIIRDPLALWIIICVWQKGLMPKSLYLSVMVIIGALGILTAMFLGHGNLAVAVFGARILLIQFPLIFAIGRIFNRDDVVKIGKVLLWISIPMAVLIALQFYSPQSAWVNIGIGGDTEGGGFSGAMGFFRPPGTFSFTNGNSLFFGLVATFVIYFWLNPKEVSRYLLIMASLAVMMAIPLSISRTLMFTIGVSLVFAVVGASRNSEYAGKIILASILLFGCVFLLSQLSFIQTSMNVLNSRFENASDSEGGLEGTLVTRYLGGMIRPFIDSSEQPFFGYGIGMGTSVGAQLVTGKVSYLIDEGECGRLFGEMGLIMGLGIILVRLGLCFKLLIFSYKNLVGGDMLPWILLSFGLLNIPQGQWSQPTSLGFSVLIGGLLFAAMRKTAPGLIMSENVVFQEGTVSHPIDLELS